MIHFFFYDNPFKPKSATALLLISSNKPDYPQVKKQNFPKQTFS